MKWYTDREGDHVYVEKEDGIFAVTKDKKFVKLDLLKPDCMWFECSEKEAEQYCNTVHRYSFLNSHSPSKSRAFFILGKLEENSGNFP